MSGSICPAIGLRLPVGPRSKVPEQTIPPIRGHPGNTPQRFHPRCKPSCPRLRLVKSPTDMAGRSFFYFRDPAYAQARGTEFLSEKNTDAEKQTALKH
jgi:hypothetical protein